MTRLSVGGLNHYYLCYECERVRQEARRPDSSLIDVRYYKLTNPMLSRTAKEQAEELLRLRGYQQGSLFADT